MAEMAWVRRLARAIVRDDALADDVAQDTWLIAHKEQPTTDRSLRPWLARVVFSLVHTRRRTESRRNARELAASDARAVPTPAELVERVELQRALAEEVLALDEPYRSTVLLHFFEGLSSAELAARLGIPAGTVRRRLKVALDQLRDALSRRADPPARGWLAALAPLAKSHLPGTSSMGVIATKKIVAAAALILLVLACGFFWKRHRDERGSTWVVASTALDLRMMESANASSRISGTRLRSGVQPRRIAGRVVAGGSPVPRAVVRLAVVHEGSNCSDESALELLSETTSAADGTFDFGAEPASIYSVSAAAPEHSPVAVRVALADPQLEPEHLELEMGSCRTRLVGIVTDAGGVPIANAHVTSAGLGGVVSEASGHYNACIAPPSERGTGSAVVRVEADGYGAVQENVLVLGDLHHDFVLAPEAVLVGRVTSAGRAVSGAWVIAKPASNNAGYAFGNSAKTDDDGRFRITGLAPVEFALSASAEHLGTVAPVVAVARPAATAQDNDLEAVALGRVSGRLVMAGMPVAGAAVAVALGSEPLPGGSISRTDGSFVLERVPFATVRLVAPPYQVVAPATLNLTRNLDGITLEVGRLASLRGRVTRNGKPVSRAAVTCQIASPPEQSVTADTDGEFKLDGLPAGVSECAAWDPQDYAFTVPTPILLVAGQDKHFDFDVDRAGAVEGTVVDEVGQSVPRAYVRMDPVNGSGNSCEAVTNDHGGFNCRALAGGDFAATVAPSSGARQKFAPASGVPFAMIQVPKQRALTGVVLAIKNDRATVSGNVYDDRGAALANVSVRAVGDRRHGTGLPTALSDSDGHFELRDLAPGTYNLVARDADGIESETVVVTGAASNVKISLPRPGAVVGSLVGFSHIPLVTARLTMTDSNAGTAATVDGTTFSASGLTPGHYTVEAEAGTDVDGSEIDIRSGETARVILTSRGHATIVGHIVELASHAPVAGMRCDAILSVGGQMSGGPPDSSRQVLTDAGGHFHIDAPTGHVRVLCFFPMGDARSPAGTDLELSPGATASADVVTVRATYGAAPGDLGLTLLARMLPVTVDEVDTNGPAAATGLRAGDHIVSIDGTSLQGMLPQGANTLLQNHHPGSTAVLDIERGGVTRTISIVVGS